MPLSFAPSVYGKLEISGFDKFNPEKMFAVDTETTGLDMWGPKATDPKFVAASAFFVSMCDENGNRASARFPINPFTRKVQYDKETVLLLRKYLENPKLEKILHNHTFDCKILRKMGVFMNGKVSDTMIRMHMLRSDLPTFGLKPLSKMFLEIDDQDQKDLQDSAIKGRRLGKKLGYLLADHAAADYWLADPALCRKYGEEDAFRTMSLYLAQEQEIAGNKKMETLCHQDRQLMHILDRIETRGVRVDMGRIDEVIIFYDKIALEAQSIISKTAGPTFNPASSKQMQRLFFDKLGHIPTEFSRKKKTKTYVDCVHCKGYGCKICAETGRNPKCNSDFLEKIACDRVDDKIVVKDQVAYNLLMHSAAEHMLQSVRQYKTLAQVESDGVHVVHPNYRQAKVRTGRLSCSAPNLQSIASEDSGKRRTDVPYRPRECFIPRPGYLFYVPDYSQIEVWVLALLANDRDLITALSIGGDAHQIVADIVWPNSYDKAIVAKAKKKKKADLTKEESKHLKIATRNRKIIKTINFGIIYGAGDDHLGVMIGCSTMEAGAFRKKYESTFPGVKKFMAECVALAKEQGYVESPYGIKYHVDRGLEYRALNYIVQGSAAKLLKSGMIELQNVIDKNPKWCDKMFMEMQIHDELMIEVHKSIHSMATMKEVVRCMAIDSKFLGCPIEFPIGMKIAEERWSDSYEVKVI